MGASDDAVQTILKDLDGLLTLNAWQATLLHGAREKAAALLGGDCALPAPPTPPPPAGAGPDCAGGGGGSLV